MKFTILSSALLLLLGACTPAPVVTEIAPLTPTGTVVGVVDDAFSGAPLPNFRVSHSGNEDTLASENGRFVIENVPAGPQIPVLISSEGYSDALLEVPVVSVGGAQENALTGVGPISLMPLSSGAQRATIRLLDSDRTPVDDATITAVLNVAFFDRGQAQGQLFGSAQLAENGEYQIHDLPNLQSLAAVFPEAQLQLSIESANEALAPKVESLSLASFFASSPYEITVNNVIEAEFRIAASNVEELRSGLRRAPSVLNTADSLSLTFSRGVTLDEVDFIADVIPTPTLSGDSIVVSFAPFEAGQKYNFTVSVPVEDFSKSVVLFTQTPPKSVVSARVVNGEGTLLCPNQDGLLEVALSGQAGARNSDGSQAPVVRANAVVNAVARPLTFVDRVAGFSNTLRGAWTATEAPGFTLTFDTPTPTVFRALDPEGQPWVQLTALLDRSACIDNE